MRHDRNLPRLPWKRAFRLWAWFFPVLLFSQPTYGQTLTTIAGGATPSPTPGTQGDGGPATVANLGCPEDIAFDSIQNLYIADGCNLKVRKVDASTGIITTVAGTGAVSYTGDGGPATLATLNFPDGLAIDAQNNLYIADYYNNVIRMVSSAGGTITTVVGVYPGGGYSGDGGPATLAQLNNPQGVKFDAQGNMYISDSSNHAVRRVDKGTSIITTFAGCCPAPTPTPSSSGDGGPATLAKLVSPEGMAFDAGGNLYITDDGAFNVRKVAMGTGTISTVAGNGSQGSSGDGGPATLAQLSAEVDGIVVGCGGNLYIADGNNHRVRVVSGAPGTITTVMGTGTPGYSNNVPMGSAQLNHPEAFLFDSQSNLILANYISGTVQKVSPFCTVTPTPSPTLSPTKTFTPTATTVGCGSPIETYFYPNPASGNNATIFCNLCESGQVTLNLYNVAANLVETYSYHGNAGANNFYVNIGSLSHGIYYYVVQEQGTAGLHKSTTHKFAVTR